jgi:hypothetical protein
MITEHFMELEKQVRSLNYNQAESGKSSAISFSLSSSSGAWYPAEMLSESLLYSDITPFNSPLYSPKIFYNRSRAFQLIPKQASYSRNESCIRDSNLKATIRCCKIRLKFMRGRGQNCQRAATLSSCRHPRHVKIELTLRVICWSLGDACEQNIHWRSRLASLSPGAIKTHQIIWEIDWTRGYCYDVAKRKLTKRKNNKSRGQVVWSTLCATGSTPKATTHPHVFQLSSTP